MLLYVIRFLLLASHIKVREAVKEVKGVTWGRLFAAVMAMSTRVELISCESLSFIAQAVNSAICLTNTKSNGSKQKFASDQSIWVMASYPEYKPWVEYITELQEDRILVTFDSYNKTRLDCSIFYIDSYLDQIDYYRFCWKLDVL